MKIQSISCVYFSPTGTTKKIVTSIAQGINAESVQMVDITKRSSRERQSLTCKDDLVVLATPVYYGRVPEEIVAYLTALQAEQTPVALVVVYGNREIEDALKELHDIAVAGKFIPLAGGVFVAEHSYSSSAYPIAAGRPDEGDLKKAREFGVAVREKFQNMTSLKSVTPLTIPGQAPYVEPKELNMIKAARSVAAFTPETDPARCTQCGECVEACPTGAISADDVTQTDKWHCSICFACVKTCPVQAKQMNDPNFQGAIQMLHQNCQERKEPEWYL